MSEAKGRSTVCVNVSHHHPSCPSLAASWRGPAPREASQACHPPACLRPRRPGGPHSPPWPWPGRQPGRHVRRGPQPSLCRPSKKLLKMGGGVWGGGGAARPQVGWQDTSPMHVQPRRERKVKVGTCLREAWVDALPGSRRRASSKAAAAAAQSPSAPQLVPSRATRSQQWDGGSAGRQVIAQEPAWDSLVPCKGSGEDVRGGCQRAAERTHRGPWRSPGCEQWPRRSRPARWRVA